MDNLPKSIQDIAGVVGMAAALSLVKHCGGRPDLIVPLKPEGKLWARLVAWMGLEAAEKFQQHFLGERINVPKCAAAVRAARNQKIIDDYEAGANMHALVDRYDMTVRQLRTILNSVPGAPVEGIEGISAGDDRQMGLF